MCHWVRFRRMLDPFTVSLHSPNGRRLPAVRAVQGDCKWPLKNGGNSHRSRESIMWGFSHDIKGSANQAAGNTTNWKPCLIHTDCQCFIAARLGPWSSLGGCDKAVIKRAKDPYKESVTEIHRSISDVVKSNYDLWKLQNKWSYPYIWLDIKL